MGSVQYDITCPICGNENAFEESDYRRNSIYSLCDLCGYYRNVHPDWDDVGLAKKEENGQYIYIEEKNEHPYGCYRVQGKIGQVGTLKDEEDYNYLKGYAERNAHLDNLQYIEISRYINGNIEKERLNIKSPEIVRVITPEDPYGEENWTD